MLELESFWSKLQAKIYSCRQCCTAYSKEDKKGIELGDEEEK